MSTPSNSVPVFPADDSVRVIPLGGLGEVGMNLMLYETWGRILVVDCGLLFPGDEHPGTRYLIPDLTYLRENAGRVEAIFLTHGHEDHVGALPHLLKDVNVPIYGTPLTLGLIRPKLAEWGLGRQTVCRSLEPGKKVKAGPFEIEPVPVTHSIVDAVAFAIGTPQGVFFHTGDFKIDPTPTPNQSIDLDRIRALGDAGITALLSDSTNVEREGHTPSERTVGTALSEIFASHKGRILIATFSTNIDRIQQILDVAAASGREAALVGRSLQGTVRVARELGYLKPPRPLLTSALKMQEVPPEKLCVLTTGTQGEPFSALSRIAAGKHPSLHVLKGDLVILSSRTIPGNERAISRTLNQLYGLGAEVIYHRVSEVHVSGHGAREELSQMIELLRPKFFVPVHGETRQLVQHARLAEQHGVSSDHTRHIEDGAVLRFEGDKALLEGHVPAGPVPVDRSHATELPNEILIERYFLGSHGLLVATVHVNPATGKLLRSPSYEMRGLAQNGHTGEDLTRVVREAILEYYKKGCDHDSAAEAVIAGLRRYFRKHSAIVPFIVPVVIEQP